MIRVDPAEKLAVAIEGAMTISACHDVIGTRDDRIRDLQRRTNAAATYCRAQSLRS